MNHLKLKYYTFLQVPEYASKVTIEFTNKQ